MPTYRPTLPKVSLLNPARKGNFMLDVENGPTRSRKLASKELIDELILAAVDGDHRNIFMGVIPFGLSGLSREEINGLGIQISSSVEKYWPSNDDLSPGRDMACRAIILLGKQAALWEDLITA